MTFRRLQSRFLIEGISSAEGFFSGCNQSQNQESLYSASDQKFEHQEL